MPDYKTVVSYEKIIDKVTELAEAISNDYDGKELVLVATLKGSFIFLADIVREMSIPLHVDFISVSSYEGAAPANRVKYHYGPLHDVKGKNVIIIEDIIDTGATIRCVVDRLIREGAKDVKVCALLKRESDKKDILFPDYLGFTIKEGFVIGYGLDYNEDFRALKGIYEFSR